MNCTKSNINSYFLCFVTQWQMTITTSDLHAMPRQMVYGDRKQMLARHVCCLCMHAQSKPCDMYAWVLQLHATMMWICGSDEESREQQKTYRLMGWQSACLKS